MQMDCQLVILLPGVKGATTKLEEMQDLFPVGHPSSQSIRTLAGLGASDYKKAKSTELWPREIDKTRLSTAVGRVMVNSWHPLRNWN